LQGLPERIGLWNMIFFVFTDDHLTTTAVKQTKGNIEYDSSMGSVFKISFQQLKYKTKVQ